MSKKFNVKEIVITDPKKSSLDMGAGVKGTGKVGRLIPVFQQELLPNTTVRYTPNTLARFVPLAVPLMSNMTMRHHVIAVPFRQLVKDWETFITGGEFNTDNSSIPTFSIRDVYALFNSYTQLDDIDSDYTPSQALNKFKSVRHTFYDIIGYGTVFDQLFGALILQFTETYTNNTDVWTADLARQWNYMCGVLFNQWIGTGSLMDYLGYPVRDWTILLNDNNIVSDEASDKINVIAVQGSKDDYYIFGGLITDTSMYDEDTKWSDLPVRAYYRIWYYYFRDQNLDIVGDGYTPEDLKSVQSIVANISWFRRLFMLRPCAWSKDLFNTTTLQAYETNAFVPTSTGTSGVGANNPVEVSQLKVYQDGTVSTMSVPTSWLSNMNTIMSSSLTNNDIAPKLKDLGNSVTGFTLQNMKKVEALAKWLDKNLYAGWCYADQLSSHFGVRYSDARMQLPEYVGGTKSLVQCQTLTNATTTSEDVAGSQSAYAQGITANDSCEYFAEEHAIIFDIMSIVPELSYKYSSPKHLMHIKKFDFAFPEFAQLGCDIVPSCNIANSIIFALDPDDNNYQSNLMPFAYADRYYEYKNNINRLTGKLVDDNPLYTFTQDYRLWKDSYFDSFVNTPTLNPDFIHCVPSVDNFVSDSIEYEFMFDHEAEVKATLPLPVVEYV